MDDLPALSGDRFTDLIGLEVHVDDDGQVHGRCEVTRALTQPYGLVHGGVYCSIVETLASVAAALHPDMDGNVVGVSNHTDFLRATREGATLHAVAEAVHLGRSQQLWQVRIWRAADDKDVARGQVRLQRLPGEAQVAP